MSEIRVVGRKVLAERFTDSPAGLGAARRFAEDMASHLGEELEIVRLPRSLRDGEHWITLSTGRRVEIDEEGRITKGGPKDFRGVHIGDVPEFAHQWRDLNAVDCEDVPAEGRQFHRNKREVYEAILSENPTLLDFLEATSGECSSAELLDYARSVRKHGLADWRAALVDAIPGRGRWEDLWNSPRLQGVLSAIERATDWPGGRIHPPLEVSVGSQREEQVEQCERDVEGRLEHLIDTARTERLDGQDEDEGVPF